MPPHLSNRVKKASPSQTLSISSLAARLRKEGKDVINLAAGQPDFDTPEHIKTAAIKAIQQGQTKYTAVDGISALKTAIVNKLQRENNLSYKPDQILVSCGAKHSLYNLFQASLNDGDEVIIPAPYWVSYPEIVKLAGGVPIALPTSLEQHFKIQATDLEKAITSKTRLVMLNSPNNPSGMMYDKHELSALAEVLLQYPDITIASDDIYEHILFGNNTFNNILNVSPQLYDRTVIINGVSKAFSMTGWRIGYAAADPDIIKMMKLVQSQSTSNPTTISQYAAQAALEGPMDFIKESKRIFEERHAFVHKTLNEIDGVRCLPSDGSFYIFPDFSALIAAATTINDDLDLSTYLLNKFYVATVPGTAFGSPGHLRISFSTDMMSLKESMERIKKMVNSLKSRPIPGSSAGRAGGC